jgi:hypothetical protein
VRPAPILALALLGAAACRPADQLEVRFITASQGQASTELRVFLFSAQGGEASCEALDPRGLGPGDAAARTGLTPAVTETFRADAGEVALPKVPDGPYTVVIEAWGPPCAEVRSGADEPICARLGTTGVSVLRGYYCNAFDLGRRRVDGAADLTSFADVGAVMTVPTGFPAEADRFPEDAPLLIADGLPGRARFMVQLLDGTADELDDVKVLFRVESGAGALVEPQPRLTALDPDIQDQGLAASTLRAERFASGDAGGAITVLAHAPGFEGSPMRFYAQALPSVDVSLERVLLPEAEVDLAGVDVSFMPLAVADLDGDGRQDVVTTTGYNDHRLVIHYGGASTAHVGPVVPRGVRALAVARLQANLPSVVVSVSQRDSTTLIDTPHGRTYQVEEPGLLIYGGVATRGVGGALPAPTRVDALGGAPIRKVAVTMTAADLDGDGVDELAMARCSYLYLENAGQTRVVRCFGRITDRTDSDVALLSATATAGLALKATIAGSGLEGGFREVAFADLNGDSSLDLVFASNSEVHGACGKRFQGAIGFGFDGASPFDTTITFGAGYAVATGDFDDVPGRDAVITGAVRAASTTAGFKAVGGQSCSAFDPGPPPYNAGSKTPAQYLIVRAADLNGDGYDDLLFLHRNTRTLKLYLGGGRLQFAAGPVLELPTGFLSELAVGTEQGPQGPEVVAAMSAPAENAIYRVRLRRR